MDRNQQVGEWITVRRDQLGFDAKSLAEAVGVDPKTVTNVETGRTAIRKGTRATWEKVLGWPIGSITAAYNRGERPEVVEGGTKTVTPDLSSVPLEQLLGEIARRAAGPRERDAAAGPQEPV